MSMYDAQTLRWLRRRALEAAARYWAEYRKEHFGYQRRMTRRMLDLARNYRREEHDETRRAA